MTDQKTAAQEKAETQANERLAGVNRIYQGRVDNLAEADAQKQDQLDEAEDGFEHSETELVEEQRFVANPDNLRKDVDSEEKFSEGLEDHPIDVEVGGATVKDGATKKTAAKKTAAKK